MALFDAVTPRSGEIYTHTAIRGIAALCVVGYHAALASSGNDYTSNPVQNYLLNSFVFVDFFFILSGFIMLENYSKKIKSKFAVQESLRFWKKRLQKILPNYYFWLSVAIIITFANWMYFESKEISYSCLNSSIWKHVFLIQNIAPACYHFNIPLWSVAVEVVAYLAFPAIVMARLSSMTLLAIGIAMYSTVFFNSETIDIIDEHLSIIRCLAGFTCGMAAAQIAPRNWPAFVHFLLVAILIFSITMNYQVATLTLMLIVTFATTSNVSMLAHLSKMRLPYLLGRSSFSIYLAHVPVAMAVSVVAYKIESVTGIPFATDWKISVAINLFLAAVVGLLAYEWIERRFEKALKNNQEIARSR